jgi:hypothetical protein
MRSLEYIDFVSCVSGNFEKMNHFQNNPFAGKFWRENFGGKILAGSFWRENFGGKILAGKFWRENFGGKIYLCTVLKAMDCKKHMLICKLGLRGI